VTLTDWSDADYAQAALDMLPDTAEEIAEFFLVQGINGERRKCWSCPVAVWLERWTGRLVEVGWSQAYVGDEVLALPQAAAKFISRFDSGWIAL
jgi:hypothetical protein